MQFLAHTPLQRKLVIAFVLVLLIPTVVSLAYHLVGTRNAVLEEVDEYQRLAAMRAVAAEALMLSSGADVLLAAQAPATHQWARAEPGARDELLHTFTTLLGGAQGRYAGLCLLDRTGQERACVRGVPGQYSPVAAAALTSRGNEPFFQRVLSQHGRRASSPVVVALPDLRAPGGPLLRYAAPIEDDRGALCGVIALEVRAAPLFEMLTAPEPGVRTLIVDRTGAVLLDATPGQPRRLGASALDALQPLETPLFLQQPGDILHASANRPATLQVSAQIRPRNQEALWWTVIYSQPLAVVTGNVWKIQGITVAITLAVLLVALLVADALARNIVRPIGTLAVAAERVGNGDLDAPIPHTGNDEIGALARIFDRTVSRLRDAIASAEGQRHEAETILAATRALSSTLALDRVLDLILSELRKVVPYDSASVQAVHGDTAEIIGAYGLKRGNQVIGMRFLLIPGSSPNAEVAAARAPVILHDAPGRYPIFATPPYHEDAIHSWLGVPLLFGERLIGMLTLDKHEVGFFTAEHARLAAAFANQAAIAIEHARLYEAARCELRERRRAEASRARLAAIIEATTDFVGIFDPNGRVRYLNRAAHQLIGLAEDAELANLQIADFVPHPAATRLLDEAVAHTLRTGSWAGEMTLLGRDGEEIPVSQVMITHHGDNGQPEYLATIIRDMREHRRAEEEQRQSQKMEALGRLAGGIAHDFNNLLTVILGEADMLLDDLPDDAPLRASAEQIRQSGSRAATLIRQLLTFSRRQVFQSELIDLNTVITGMEQLLRRLINEDIVLTIMLTADLPAIRADPGQIEQVVLNLALNARDAMPEGGQLLIATSAGMLDPDDVRLPAGGQAGPCAVLTVCDTGVGIAPETQEHIFEPFFTTKPRGQGTGLGLATVHGIVRQSGGHIWFTSEPGHGTTFIVYLPAADGAVHSTTVRRAGDHACPPGGTVLLVEDDEGVRLLTRQILLRAGFSVLEATDGQAALTLAAGHSGPIDVLLTDVVMPRGLNGMQLAATLRASRPAIAVVYMSGYIENAQIDRSMQAGDGRFIQKPFTAETLINVLNEALASPGPLALPASGDGRACA